MVRADGRTIPVTPEDDVDGGTRLTVDVPRGSRQIVLTEETNLRPWSLAVAEATTNGEIVSLLGLGRTGKYTEALSRLEALKGQSGPREQGPIEAAIGRMAIPLGDVEHAESALRAAMASARSDGRLFDEVKDGSALIWALVMLQQRFSDARILLADIERSADEFPEGRAWIAYHAGLLAAHTGDVRTALQNYRLAEKISRRLRQTTLLNNASMEVAVQLAQIGRSDEALTLLRALPPPPDPCARASLALNIEWTVGQSGNRRPTGSSNTELSAASALAEETTKACPDPHRRALAAIHAADMALQGGNEQAIERTVRALEVLPDLRDVRLDVWRTDILGRWFLRKKAPAQALLAFDGQTRRARVAGLAQEEFRGQVGAGRALLALRRRAAGITRLRAALSLLEVMLREIPIGDGRGSFLDGHDDCVRDLVSALVESGAVRDAMEVARWMRTVELVNATRADRLHGLDASDRRHWDEALGRYQRIRKMLARQAEDDWETPRANLARVQAGRQAAAEEARAALDEAYRLLGGSDSPTAARRPPAAPGDLILCFFPGENGWYLFAETSSATKVRRFSDSELDDPSGAANLLATLAPEVRAARRLRLLPYASANRVDWPFVDLDGRPLISTLEVEYGLDLPARPSEGSSPDSALRGLVVADPTGDLPAALGEAELVARMLPGWRLTRLQGAAATRTALLERLPQTDLFHYAGHAEVSAAQSLESALLLAGNSRMDLGDVLAAASVPRLVVLSACEAAGASSGHISLMGLAQGFVAAGAHAAIAPTGIVSDRAAQAFFEAFYRAFGGRVGIGEREFRAAYRAAALEMWDGRNRVGLGPEDSGGWGKFRLLVY